MYCSKCGLQNPDDASYCVKCGAKMDDDYKEGIAQKTEPEIEKKGINEPIKVGSNIVKEYRTLVFPNTTAGQNEKVRTINALSKEGWKVVSETITQGQFKGKTACCLAIICLPFGFCAGSTEGNINVTLEKDTL